jgi:hypothetical protein
MMRRTQIMLDPDEHTKATRKAAEAGISLAEYIRRLVRQDVADPPRTDMSAIIGLGDSGRSDISSNIHEYVGEAIEADWKRKTGRT